MTKLRERARTPYGRYRGHHPTRPPDPRRTSDHHPTPPSPLGTRKPRTRGVYVSVGVDVPGLGGLSPHTRGLHGPRRGRQEGVRIIPAHAGFTPDDRPQGRPGPDHPRTRGVYAAIAVTSSRIGGSSPHTRGLLGVGHRPPQRRVDHPRTRGVYSTPSTTRGEDPGSSPHTRGLLSSQLPSGITARIIPAHAGFTTPGPPRARTPRDHPRTRGVYPAAGVIGHRIHGSSPHTRGLLPRPSAGGMSLGIIPAHAGFT